MKFDKNKSEFIHKWYPFVEGYSKEFIESILKELNYKPNSCLDPYSGSGTTPVELQLKDTKCTSFEVSPFMHLLSRVKLYPDYSLVEFKNALDRITETLEKVKGKPPVLGAPIAETIVEKPALKKWIFHRSTMDGILDIKYAITKIENPFFRDLFHVGLASILLEVSNVFRNGKCLSYRKGWQDRTVTREDVHQFFIERVEQRIAPDIDVLAEREKSSVSNYSTCYLDDVRIGLPKLRNNSFDLLITSPPYLNSRDYTDIYRIELWVLDLIQSYDAMYALRKRTMTSHVQVKLGEIETPASDLLKGTLKKIEQSSMGLWNNDIPSMVKGYFRDLDFLLFTLKQKMKVDRRLYFNLANSAYCGVEVKVDEVFSELAERNGFKVVEIRKARDLKTSAQQKNLVKSLRESVTIIES